MNSGPGKLAKKYDSNQTPEEMRAEIAELRAQLNKANTALSALLEMYVQLANSGDCGNWNPEEEDEVIAARAALKP